MGRPGRDLRAINQMTVDYGSERDWVSEYSTNVAPKQPRLNNE